MPRLNLGLSAAVSSFSLKATNTGSRFRTNSFLHFYFINIKYNNKNPAVTPREGHETPVGKHRVLEDENV